MNISNLATIALSIGVAIITISLVVIILDTIKKDKGIVPDQTATHLNETFNYVNATVINVLENRLVSGSEKVWNSSTLVNQGANGTGNYTMEYGSDGVRSYIYLTNTSPNNLDGWNATNATWSISYEYYYGSSARNATERGIEAQLTMASFLQIVALVAAGAIIIGVVVRALMNRREDL